MVTPFPATTSTAPRSGDAFGRAPFRCAGEDLATFLMPSLITTDLSCRVSPRAIGLMSTCVRISMTHEAGAASPIASANELQLLAEGCTLLSTELVTDNAELSNREREFDEFFRLRRSSHADAFVMGIVAAVIAAVIEMGHSNSLLPVEIAAIVGALHRIAREFLRDEQTEAMLSITDDDTADKPLANSRARWRNGHVVFVGLIASAIYFHLKVIEAIAARDNVAANFALRDASCIFHGSAAALRLAGDLTPEQYDDIRELMAPPNLSEGFSGTWNTDHRHLLKLVKQLGAAIQITHPAIASAREEYLLSINAAYGAHRYVCQQVVGQAASLATQLRAPERPGHQTLKFFAKRTLSLAGDDSRRENNG
jgi:hypothetical protein